MVQYGPRRLKPSAAGPPAPNDTMRNIQLFKGVFWFNNNWLPPNMIPCAVGGSGSLTWGNLYVYLKTGMSSGSYAFVGKGAEGLTGAYSWDKKRFFGLRVNLLALAGQILHLVSGYVSGFTQVENTGEHIGFKLVGANLYGTVGDGTNESTLLLLTLPTGDFHTLECVLEPEVECRFYVDGVDRGAIKTNLPNGTTYANAMVTASIANTVAAERYFYLYESRTLQEE